MNVPIRTMKDFNTETELFIVNTRFKQDVWNNIPLIQTKTGINYSKEIGNKTISPDAINLTTIIISTGAYTGGGEEEF